jgi:hypothetical protein
MSKEALDQHDEEERIALGGDATPAALEAGTANQPQTQTPLPMSNWQYFLHGSGLRRQQVVEARTQQVELQARNQVQPAVELQDRAPQTGEQGGAVDGVAAVAPVETPVQQPSRSRWQRLMRR